MGVENETPPSSRFQAPRQLVETDDTSTFCSGVKLVDDWIHTTSHVAVQRGTAVPYVSCTLEGEVAGLFSLNAFSIPHNRAHGEWLRRDTPSNIPVILLGIFGVDKRFQGLGLGWGLLEDAVLRARHLSANLGVRALVVEPYDDNARGFYSHFGFQPVIDTEFMFVKIV